MNNNMNIYEEQKTIVFSPREFKAVSSYLAEHANDFNGWTVTVDMDYGFIQGVKSVLASEEVRLRIGGK